MTRMAYCPVLGSRKAGENSAASGFGARANRSATGRPCQALGAPEAAASWPSGMNSASPPSKSVDKKLYLEREPAGSWVAAAVSATPRMALPRCSSSALSASAAAVAERWSRSATSDRMAWACKVRLPSGTRAVRAARGKTMKSSKRRGKPRRRSGGCFRGDAMGRARQCSTGFVQAWNHQSQTDAAHHGFGAAGRVELVVDLGQVALHGPIANGELGADGLVGETLGRQS